MLSDESAMADHRVASGARALVDELGELLEVPVLSLGPQAAREALVSLHTLRSRVEALTLRVAAQADRVGVAAASGAASTGAWWAARTQQPRPVAVGQVRLGRVVEERWLEVGRAFAAGELAVDQVRVVVAALEELPDDLDAALVLSAERHLVALAGEHDARHLRILGRAILEHLAPDVAEEHERRQLEAEERRAGQRTRLTLSRDGHGSMHGRFTVPEAHGAAFEKALWALASPRHRAAVETGDDRERATAGRPAPQKLGDAFCELIDSLSSTDLPRAGGVDATMLVTIRLDDLIAGVGSASLDTGERITAAEARRRACEARIIPVVLGGRSEVLDLGRARRFHTKAMRHAATVRDRGCTAEDCDWPPAMCHLHHERPWAEGGGTSVADSRLLCPHHHRRIHDPEYESTRLPKGQVRFHRRT